MTEQTSPEPDVSGLRFLSTEQYRDLAGQDALDRQLERLAARRRAAPDLPEATQAAGEPDGPP